MLSVRDPVGLSVYLGAGNTRHAGVIQVDDKGAQSTLPSEATASQAEHFSCTQARYIVLPNEVPRKAVTRWHKGSSSHSSWVGLREELQPPGSATAHGAAWPQA